MFCRKNLYHKIGKVHHRTLKVICQSEESYQNLLLESSSVSIHQKHLRFLVTEIYKSTTQRNPEFMWPYFTYNNISFNLREGPILCFPARIQHSTVLILFILEDPGFGIIFLAILNLENQYPTLKPSLEVVIADV